MSLSATLSAGGTRPASFLPTIKCSSCGDEIEISAMGDHLCSKAPPSPKSQPASLSNPFTLRQLNASRPTQPSPLQFDSRPVAQTRPRAPTVGSSQTSTTRIPRAPLPNINPDAANRPFLVPLPRPESPISPAVSTRSGSSAGNRPQAPLRSMTSPMPRLWDLRPPSPELSANLDCAFPPFPFHEPGGSRPSSSNGRRTPSDRGSSPARSRQEGKLPDVPPAGPRSPSTSKTGDNVFSRIDTLRTGPFDAGRRRPSREEREEQSTQPLDRRRPSIPDRSVTDRAAPIPSASKTVETQSVSAPVTGRNDGLTPVDLGSNSNASNRAPPQRPVRPTESLTPSLLDKLTAEPISTVSSEFPQPPRSLPPTERSLTFPLPKDKAGDENLAPTLTKIPSEPALRGRTGRPALPGPSNSEPSKPFPSRSTSRAGDSRVDHRMQDAPPVPKPVQLHRSGSSHRPSGSDSSTASSTASVQHSSCSKSDSPATSAASSVDAFSPLSAGTSNGDDRGMRVAGLSIRNHDKPGMRAEQLKQNKSPPRNFARPAPLSLADSLPLMESPVIPANANWPLESPMDPSFRHGTPPGEEPSLPTSRPEAPKPLDANLGLSPADISSDDYDPYRPNSPRLPLPPQHSLGPYTGARSKTNNTPQQRPISPVASARSQSRTPQPGRPQAFTPPPPPPQIPQDASRPSLSRKPTTGAKATCRGCNKLIEGKSVKAADGRLTGRWHKHCFTCQTCHQPFTSADFYVINNNPYCEQHYHEANGSTCAGCRRGIEGQYLETTSSRGQEGRKFHPRCFTCAECRVVLAEDYFEIGGRVFCERHALGAMRGQPRPARGPSGLKQHIGLTSGLKAERRTTKLMMMG